MLRFISFIVKDKDIEFLTSKCLSERSGMQSAYYHTTGQDYHWQSLTLMGSAGNIELVIPDMDLLPEVLLLISVGTPESEIRRMFNG